MKTDTAENILIVDGYATGSQYAARIRARGMKPYHITSGWEKRSSFSADFMDKYIKSQVGGFYEACWRMPDDFEQLLNKLKAYHFKAVIPGTETGVIAAEMLAGRLGLPVNRQELLWARRDKYQMQQALRKAGLRHIPSLLTESLPEALAWFREKGFKRIIIKPCRSAGTDGVVSCTTEAQIAAYFRKYLNQTDAAGERNTRLLLQQYIEGDEMVVNCVSRAGKHIMTDILLYNKVLTERNVPVYEASRLVHKITAPYKQAVQYTFKVLDALGITYGSSHSEIKLTPQGPVLVETGARIMGSMPPQYYEALGYNLIDWSLDAYLDDEAHLEHAQKTYAPKKHFLAKFFISDQDMPIKEVTAEKTLALLPSFVTANFNTLRITKHLHKTVDMPSKPGDCLLMSQREEELLRDYEICRLLEKCADGLLWHVREKDLSGFEKNLLEQLKRRDYAAALAGHQLAGYHMRYMQYKNTQLYVLNERLHPCQPGEKGDIYVAGAYLTKRPFNLPFVHAENFIVNPYYTTILRDKKPMFPFLYKTGDKALVNADGSLYFIDKRTGALVHSFGKAKNRTDWPLTYTERQMAAEQRMVPDSNAYNAKFAFKITGNLDLERFKKALKTWVKRYRIFSSYYPLEKGRLTHRVMKNLPVELKVFSCSFEQALEQVEKLNAPYDISVPPLYRFFLFCTGQNEYLFHINIHHIIADGVSLISLIEELWKLYKNERAKQFHTEEDFFDYAVWQSNNDDHKEKAQFFLDMFKDGVPENEMPTRSARPEILPYAQDISKECVFPIDKITAKAKEMGSSVALFLTAISAAVLAKYSGSEDYVLGVIMNGRSHPQSKDIFGMFVNAVPVRFKPQAALTLEEYIKASAKVFRGVILNQTCPLEYLVPILAPRRDLSRKPIFDVIVNYRPEIPPFSTPEIQISSVQMRQATQTDMQLEILRSGQEASLSISYSKKLYQQEIINGILDLLHHMLNQILYTDVRQETLADLTEIPPQERKRILQQFSGKRTQEPLQTVVEQFFSAARTWPQRPAVCFAGKTLTYKELAARSTALAQYLRKQGINRGDRVALLANRSEQLLVYTLGVLCAGAVYVPLDGSHPAERIYYMLADSGAKLLLADQDLLVHFPQIAVPVTDTAALNNLPPCDEVSALPKAELADNFVVLYTSGTTGQPKGVCLTHQNLASFCNGHKRRFHLTPQDKVASVAGVGFDACLMDYYPTLIAGGCVHIIAQDIRFDVLALQDYYQKNHITGTLLTTQLGYQFAKNIQQSSLRYLIVGGETLPPIAPTQCYKLVNAYGPTECTVYSSCFVVDKFYERVPIGYVVDNSSSYIVDKAGRLAPIGTFGELCISGLNVAKGYLNKPDLTAEKFVPNPFSQEQDFERMYRTGDFARFTPQGVLEFLGRKDSQVKIRGFRIELGEIELQVCKYKDVKEACVIAREDKHGNKYLVAYVVPREGLDIKELKRSLEDVLPPYMIPAFFMLMPHIPLNPNGKVDRRSLPKPDLSQMRATEYVPPQGRIEKELMYIWADILNIDPSTIGREDNFFDLGGTSLRSTELSLRIREVFYEHISPALIFRYPKLHEQAAYLDAHNTFPMVFAFNTEGNKTPLFFVHTAHAGSEAYLPLAKKLAQDQPFFAVEPHNIFSTEEGIRGIENLAARYIKYIQHVRPHGPYKLGGWSFGASVAYEMAVQLSHMGEKVECLYLLDPRTGHSQEEQQLVEKLIGTSFFHGYINNDPLFARFKKLGLVDKLLSNSRAVFEDIFAYQPQRYEGQTVLFKATRPDPKAKDVESALANQLAKFQRMHIAQKDNGFGQYVPFLQVIDIHCRHDFMMRGNALEMISKVINEQGKKHDK